MKRWNLYILITIVITSYLHSGCSQGSATQTVATSVSAEDISTARSSAEALFAQRTDLAKLREGIALLSKVRDPDKRNYEIEWTFARYNYFLGRHSKDEAESEKAFTAGRDAAKIASNLDGSRPEGFFWYGANLGELCKKSPVTVGLANVGEVRNAMNRVIDIQPGYQGASAYDVLAQIELGTRLKDGTAEKAVEYLNKALDLEKDNSNIYLHLAEAYLALNKHPEARKNIETLLKLTPNPQYLPEHNESVAEAKKLLATKFE